MTHRRSDVGGGWGSNGTSGIDEVTISGGTLELMVAADDRVGEGLTYDGNSTVIQVSRLKMTWNPISTIRLTLLYRFDCVQLGEVDI